ncbi:MAG: sugar phosphate nucleotidyltransferase [Candidatus Hodarchaeales archaeon]|jgi:dTDP-glucose pyrophosphorylase
MSYQEGIDNRNISAFILAAGKGSRLYPFSQLISKPLLPLINTPIILHSIERLLLAGIDQISIVIKPEEQQIQKLLNKTYPGTKFNYIVQRKALGTGHAVLQIEKYVEHKDFMVIAGDSLFSGNFLEKLSKIHIYEKNSITLALEEMEFEEMRHCSTVDFHDGQVWNIREKPQTRADIFSNLNSAALYVFTQGIFDIINNTEISPRKEYELASAIKQTINLKKRVGGSIASCVHHISSAQDLWRTNIEFLRDASCKDSNGNLIGKEVNISTPNRVTNSVIGDFCNIHSGVTVHNSVILPNSVVKHDIKYSLVLSDHIASFLNE